LKPIFSIINTTRASPITVITVVDVVGVKPRMQTSSGPPVKIEHSDFSINGLSLLPVITITGTF
jgi:hypothetical protein